MKDNKMITALSPTISSEGTCTIDQLSEDQKLEINCQALDCQIERLNKVTKRISQHLGQFVEKEKIELS